VHGFQEPLFSYGWTGRLSLAISPRAFRLKLQGRLLLLCLGAALPIATVFALSLFDQFHFVQAQVQQTHSAKLLALAKSLDIWGQQQIWDMRAIANQSIAQISKGPLSNSAVLNSVKQHPDWAEVYRIFPDGRAIVYRPAQEKMIKLPYSAKELISTSQKRSKAAIYSISPLSGQRKLLLVSLHPRQAKFQTETPAKKPSRKALYHKQFTGKESNIDLSTSALIVAIEPKTLTRIVAQDAQELDSVVDHAPLFSSISIADGKKEIFVTTDENISSAKSEANTKKLFQVDDQVFVSPLNIYISATPAPSIEKEIVGKFTKTILLAIIALLASSYLAFIASKQFSRQIKLLVKEVLALGRGDFTKRLEIKSNDELGKLAKAFNQIASKMQLEHDHRLMEEKISLAIRQSLDLDQVLIATVTELGKALAASRVCLALVEIPKSADQSKPKNLELIFDYVWCDESKNGTPLNDRLLRLEDDSIMSMIIEQGSILSMDVLDENGPSPLFKADAVAPNDWRSIRSLIACPITSAEGTIGLILIQQCDHLRVWTDKELELVEVVTRQLTVAMQHAHLYHYTRTMAEQEMLINQIVRCVRGSLDLETILNSVTRELCSAIGADRCQILQPKANGPLVVTHESHSLNLTDTKDINLYAQQIDFNPSETEAVFSQGNFLLGIDLQKLSMRGSEVNLDNIPKDQTYDPWLVSVISDTESDARARAFKYFLVSSNSKSLIAAPLLSGNRIIGLLVVHQCDHSRTWRSGEVQLVSAIADQLALAVTQAHLFAQVKYQAITDGLTGLYNHVYFKNRLAEELRLADRKGLPCSLLMLDLDHLKQINDAHGHPVGDAAIRYVASALKTLLRSGDTAARYGGEEFSVILPETSLLEAALIGDRLCTHIANARVPGMPPITISVGAASYPRQGKDGDELINKADQALYEAKNSGRNQIWISESISEGSLPPDQIVPEFRVTRRLAIAGGRKDEETRVGNAQRQTKAE